MKKWLAWILAVSMAATMGLTAFADGDEGAPNPTADPVQTVDGEITPPATTAPPVTGTDGEITPPATGTDGEITPPATGTDGEITPPATGTDGETAEEPDTIPATPLVPAQKVQEAPVCTCAYSCAVTKDAADCPVCSVDPEQCEGKNPLRAVPDGAEGTADGWFTTEGGSATAVAGGVLIKGDADSGVGPFSKFGKDDYGASFGENGFESKITIDAGSLKEGELFSWSTGINGTGGGRKGEMYVAFQRVDGKLLYYIGSDKGERATAENDTVTIESRFYDKKGKVGGYINVNGKQHNYSEDVCDGSVDVTDVGGNRYGWFVKAPQDGILVTDGPSLKTTFDSTDETTLTEADFATQSVSVRPTDTKGDSFDYAAAYKNYATFGNSTITVNTTKIAAAKKDEVTKLLHEGNMYFGLAFPHENAASVRVADSIQNLIAEKEGTDLTEEGGSAVDGNYIEYFTMGVGSPAGDTATSWAAPTAAQWDMYFAWTMDDGSKEYTKATVYREILVQSDADSAIDDALAADDATAKKGAIEAIVIGDQKVDLTTADPDKFKNLDTAYETAANVTVTPPVPTNAMKEAGVSSVDVTGAALNTVNADTKTVTVTAKMADENGKITDGEISTALGAGLKSAGTPVQVDLSMQVNGAEQEGNLVAPLTFTIKIPTELKNLTLKILHRHGDEIDVISPIVKNGEATFTVTKLSTFAFVAVESKPSSGGGSHGGGGGGGGGGGHSSLSILSGIKGGSGVTGSTPKTSPLAAAAASKAVNSAVANAVKAGTKTANVSFRNISTVSPATMATIASAAQKSGVAATVVADTLTADGKSVAVRLYVDPAAASKLTANVNLAASNADKAVAATFAKFFKNNVAIVKFDQKGAFGVPVQAAVKLDLGKLNTANLMFYTYDAAANAYTRIANPAAFIDVNGYLHFTTTVGNNVIVTDAPLARK